MEQQFEMSSLQWSHLHWPYDKLKIVIDCIEDLHIKYIGHSFILTLIILDQVLSYLMSLFSKDEIVYNYNSLSSNSFCVNNPLNVNVRFE